MEFKSDFNKKKYSQKENQEEYLSKRNWFDAKKSVMNNTAPGQTLLAKPTNKYSNYTIQF